MKFLKVALGATLSFLSLCACEDDKSSYIQSASIKAESTLGSEPKAQAQAQAQDQAQDQDQAQAQAAVVPFAAPPQGAQQRLAVLDFNRVWSEAYAPKKIRETIQLHRKKYQTEVIQLEEELRQKEESMQKLKDSESSQDYQARRKTFEQDVLNVQKKVQENKQKLEETYVQSMKKVNTVLSEVISEIAKLRQLDVILPLTQVVFSKNSLDITETVLTELNKKMPETETAKQIKIEDA